MGFRRLAVLPVGMVPTFDDVRNSVLFNMIDNLQRIQQDQAHLIAAVRCQLPEELKTARILNDAERATGSESGWVPTDALHGPVPKWAYTRPAADVDANVEWNDVQSEHTDRAEDSVDVNPYDVDEACEYHLVDDQFADPPENEITV